MEEINNDHKTLIEDAEYYIKILPDSPLKSSLIVFLTEGKEVHTKVYNLV